MVPLSSLWINLIEEYSEAVREVIKENTAVICNYVYIYSL